MQRKIIIRIATIAVLIVGIGFGWPRVSFYCLTGRFFPVEKIDVLQNPLTVTHWTPDGLVLADRRTVPLPGLRSLPGVSAAMTEATKRGVEIHADGRVWGLVKVHHWCGNDPVREHIARIDLADMMTFLRVGEPTNAVKEAEFLVGKPGGTFTEWGWRIEEFLQFQSWQGIRNSAR